MWHKRSLQLKSNSYGSSYGKFALTLEIVSEKLEEEINAMPKRDHDRVNGCLRAFAHAHYQNHQLRLAAHACAISF